LGKRDKDLLCVATLCIGKYRLGQDFAFEPQSTLLDGNQFASTRRNVREYGRKRYQNKLVNMVAQHIDHFAPS